MRVRRRRQSLSQPEEIDLVHHQNPNHQPQSFGDFAHGHCTAAVHQVNLLALLLLPLQEQGDLASTMLETRSHHTTCERLFICSQLAKLEKAQVVPPFHLLHLHHVATERNDKPTVCSYRRQWKPLSHGHWSCSSKPLTGRTGLQTEGRFSLLETLHEPQPDIQEYSTGQGLVS